MAVKKSSTKKTRIVKKRVAVKLAPLDPSVKVYADAEKELATAISDNIKAEAKTAVAAERVAKVKTQAATAKAQEALVAAKAAQVVVSAAVKKAQARVTALSKFDAKIKATQAKAFNRELKKFAKELNAKAKTKAKHRPKVATKLRINTKPAPAAQE